MTSERATSVKELVSTILALTGGVLIAAGFVNVADYAGIPILAGILFVILSFLTIPPIFISCVSAGLMLCAMTVNHLYAHDTLTVCLVYLAFLILDLFCADQVLKKF